MKKNIQCPECKVGFPFEPTDIDQDGVTCPNCLKTVPVFSEDTWVPGITEGQAVEYSADLKIEGYEIKQRLGQGGMGLVLEGYQVSLGRRVAIKMLLPVLAGDDRFVERFEREASALAQLSHPNIVTIFERGRSGKWFYFVMEYVEGEGGASPTDLRTILNQRKLLVMEVKHFILQITRALAYAHRQGIVHRDIKPGNIMIDRHGNAKIADFGIAFMATQQTGSQLTLASSVIGTFDYMAPEQRDDAGKANHLADVFSVGVMLYEMLTGKIPRGVYQPASKIVPGLDSKWDEIILLALQSQPEFRLSGMNKFVEMLEEVSMSTSLPAERLTNIADTGVAECDSITGGHAGKPRVEGMREAARHSNSGLASIRRCPDCGNAVETTTRFCPSCRASQWLNCPDCEVLIEAVAKFCPQCGANVQSHRIAQKYLEAARKADLAAKDIRMPDSERCRLAQLAGSSAKKTLGTVPNNEEAQNLLASANQLVMRLAIRLANKAYKDKNLSRASTYLEQILAIQSDHDSAKQFLEKIQSVHREGWQKAEQYLHVGNFEKAANTFSKLSQAFPADEECARQLTECKKKQVLINEVVKKTLPSLVAENRWLAVQQEVAALEASGIYVGGMQLYANKVKRRLVGIEPFLQEAERLFEQGHAIEAGAKAERVLQTIADHPRALELVVSSKQAEHDEKEVCERLDRLNLDRRWFAAAAALELAAPLSKGGKVGSAATLIREGREAANAYARLLLWSLLGTLVLVIAAEISGAFSAGVSVMLGASGNGIKAIPPAMIQDICWLVFFLTSSTGGIVGLRKLLGRPVKPTYPIWIIGIIGLCVGSFVAASAIFSGDDDIPVQVLQWLKISGSGIVSGFAIALLSKDIVRVPKGNILKCVVVGTLSFLTAKIVVEIPNDFLRFLMPAIWLHSWMLIIGISQGWWRSFVIIAMGLVAGILVAGMVHLGWVESEWSRKGTALLLLFGTAIFIATHRRIVPLLIICGMLFVSMRECNSTLTISTLTAFWAVTALLADDSRASIDPRLHIFDRINRGRDRSSFGPANVNVN